jgi:hypothetical protein
VVVIWWVTVCLMDLAMLLGCVTTGNSVKMASHVSAGFRGSSDELRDIFCDMIPCTAKLVVLSDSLLFLRSTSNPKCRRKSAPRIGVDVSARMKTHLKVRRSPRLRVRERVPKVGIGVLLTAWSVRSERGCRRSLGDGGRTLT